MASASVLGAYLERYGTFTVAATVPLYVTFIPLKGATGLPVNPPVSVVEDLGTTPAFDFEYHPLETTRLKHTIYAVSDADVDSYVSAVRYNGGAVNAGLGMDFAASLPLTGMTLKQVTRDREQRGRVNLLTLYAAPVFYCSITYSIDVLRTA